MTTERFAKVPAWVLALMETNDLTARQLKTYLASILLANYNPPRIARTTVGTVAQAAGIDRAHASRALKTISTPTATRPALVEYVAGKNQYRPAVIVIIETPGACADMAQADGACADTAHPRAQAGAQARTDSPAETPIESQTARENPPKDLTREELLNDL